MLKFLTSIRVQEAMNHKRRIEVKRLHEMYRRYDPAMSYVEFKSKLPPSLTLTRRRVPGTPHTMRNYIQFPPEWFKSPPI